MARARTHPTWALGLGDAVWWSRLAQPNPHCWTDTEVTPKLQELTPATEDTDPTALACYGRLVRPEPQQADQMWRCCVTGAARRALSQSCLSEAKSENGVSENQWLASFNFPVFGDLRQSPT